MHQSSTKGLKLAVAGLAGGAVMAGGGTNADGAVISGVFQTDGSLIVTDVTSTPSERYELDLNGDSINDVTVMSQYDYNKPGKPDDKSKYYSYSGSLIESMSDTAISTFGFLAGDEIGEGTSFSQPNAVYSGYVEGSPSTYFGLRFGSTGAYNYGWIQLREGTSPNAYDLVAYGIETTAGASIAAGETAGLALLAMGAAAIGLRRAGNRA
ncbi:MAG TPA: hypothetical protein VGN97_22475 [Mesorhizobium sp.]|jgi:hypothetical protein|nr:hypothetical protein [Mesorhizobium sp.]